MRKPLMIAAGAAVAALAALGGSAFTGTGLDNTAPATQFVGGTVTQTVTGATLASIDYSYADAPANTEVSSISLTFTNTADGHTVAVTPSGGGAGVGTFSCTDVASNASSCTYTAGTDTLTGYKGLTSLDVTVS
jgi:hypothetical protein